MNGNVLFIGGLILAAVAVAVPKTDADTAVRAATNVGMKDVKITGYRIFGCGEEDLYHTGFEATNSNGNRVSGVVCSGILKGATVRFD